MLAFPGNGLAHPRPRLKRPRGSGTGRNPPGRVLNPHPSTPLQQGRFVEQESMLPLAQGSAFVSRTTTSLRRAAGWFGSCSLWSPGRVGADSAGGQGGLRGPCGVLAPETKSGSACTSWQGSEWEGLSLTLPWGAAGAKLSDARGHYSGGHVRRVCRSLMSLVSWWLRTKLAEGRAGPSEA